jgi:hypothetical protein
MGYETNTKNMSPTKTRVVHKKTEHEASSNCLFLWPQSYNFPATYFVF